MNEIAGYIYCVTNMVNGKRYVGKTTKSIAARFAQHLKATSKHSFLAKAIRKYGKGNFSCVELARCATLQEVNDKECELIAVLGTLVPGGYNLSGGGEGGVQHPLSVEKIRSNKKEFWADEANKAKMLDRMFDPEVVALRAKGLSASWDDERKAKHAERLKELACDPEWLKMKKANASATWNVVGRREKVSATIKALRASPEERAKLRAQRVKDWATPGYREKQAAGMKAVMQTPEYKAKMSAAIKAKCADKEWLARRAAKIAEGWRRKKENAACTN